MELMKRLRKLEGIVEDLSGQIEFETYKHGAANSESPEATSSDTMHENDRRKMTVSPSIENPSMTNGPLGFPAPRRTNTGGSTTSSSLANVKGQQGGDVHKDFGKLVLNEKGKVRYVSNAFWTKITEEVCSLTIKDIWPP